MKKVYIIGLCLVLLMALMPWSTVTAEEQPEATTLTLAQLQEKYPHGAYWNHTKGGTEDYTWNPCTHHTGNCTYSGSCGCNTYQGKTIQCMGFAYQLAALAYGGDPRADWTEFRTASALDNLKPGDILRYNYNGHSVFVTAVEGDVVTYADCNGDNRCGIRWNATATKEQLKTGFTYVKAAPYALPSNATEGLEVAVSASNLTIGQEVTLTLTYDGGDKAIGGVMGTLCYDTARFAFVSFAGDGVEVSEAENGANFLYYAINAQAATAVTFSITLRAVGGGRTALTVVTEEMIDDSDYSSLGTPQVGVAVEVTGPVTTVTYHGGGGVIDNPVVGHTYRVLSDNGLNMRKDAGTAHDKVTAIPCGTLFSVAVGDTKEADGYTWGKTTYNGITGWLVISHFVEQISPILGGGWILEDGYVCHVEGTLLTHRFDYGVPMEGVCVPAEVGLYRDGYRFGGWNTAADGSGVTYVDGMTPQELCPDGGDAVTLYALWMPAILGDVDGNGRLNNKDLGLLQRYLNGWDITVSAETDMNGDGVVNNKDLALMQLALNE